ncbi:hypothetical protein ACHAQD_006574 [Fusarium lateritium]
MARLQFLSGSIALLAFAGVNAGPCRPSSSIATTTTGLETIATMSTDIGDTTTVLFTSLTTTELTETLDVALSVTETTSIETVVATTTALDESDTTTALTTEPATATADATTTTMAASTSAAPVEACGGLPSSYTGPGGTKFETLCDTITSNFVPIGGREEEPKFKTCVDNCDENQECVGAGWKRGSREC